MSDKIKIGDDVVFRQIAPDGFASESDHDILIDDGTAYIVHYGQVVKDDSEYDELSVEWSDGMKTLIHRDKLEAPSNAEWLPV